VCYSQVTVMYVFILVNDTGWVFIFVCFFCSLSVFLGEIIEGGVCVLLAGVGCVSSSRSLAFMCVLCVFFLGKECVFFGENR
jgi:hypothetical protein